MAVGMLAIVGLGCSPPEEEALLAAWCERAETWLYAVIGIDAETREPFGLDRDAQDRRIVEAHAELWAEPAPEVVRDALPDRFEVGPPPSPDPTRATADLMDPALTDLISEECDIRVGDVGEPMASQL